jgi:hypothetical protein
MKNDARNRADRSLELCWSLTTIHKLTVFEIKWNQSLSRHPGMQLRKVLMGMKRRNSSPKSRTTFQPRVKPMALRACD